MASSHSCFSAALLCCGLGQVLRGYSINILIYALCMLSSNKHLSIYILRCYSASLACLPFYLYTHLFHRFISTASTLYRIVSGFYHIIINGNEPTHVSLYFFKCQRLDDVIIMNLRGKNGSLQWLKEGKSKQICWLLEKGG